MLYNAVNFQHLYNWLKLGIISIFITASPIYASEQLDIRPHEAPDECKADVPQIRVTINNVGFGGILSVELYHDPENFLNKKGRTKRIRIPATKMSHTVCFNLEQHGTYAVASYHDRDANRKLNKRWNLMPKEPFGLSNNPKLAYSFPKFEDSAFTTSNLGPSITINLQEP